LPSSANGRGDTINTGARLEAANKELGTRICVSAAERAPEFDGRPVGDLLLKAKRADVRVRITATRGARQSLCVGLPHRFLEACSATPRRAAAFAALVGEWPTDTLAQYHLRRLFSGGAGSRIEMA
jgi:adenylate cyclase